MKGKILKFLLILIIGGLGGILADQFFLPYLATISPFSKIELIRQARDGTTIINPSEKITITENTALEQAIDKISPCLVAIQAYQGKVLISQGTGFIVTSDGDFDCLVEYLLGKNKLRRVLAPSWFKCSHLLKIVARGYLSYLEESRGKLEYHKK